MTSTRARHAPAQRDPRTGPWAIEPAVFPDQGPKRTITKFRMVHLLGHEKESREIPHYSAVRIASFQRSSIDPGSLRH